MDLLIVSKQAARVSAPRGMTMQTLCGVTSAEYAIAWVLSRPSVASVILGWRTEAQMDSLFPLQGPLAEERVLMWRDGAWALSPVEIS